MSGSESLFEVLTGKTVKDVQVTPYSSCYDGAMESIRIVFTDRTAVTFDAGSYVIPEEACIYAEVSRV